MRRHFSRRSQRSRNCTAKPTLKILSHVSDVIGQAIVLLPASSRRQNVTLVARRATSPPPADPRTRVLPRHESRTGPAGKHHEAHQICSEELPTVEDSSIDEYFLHKLGEKSSPITVSLVANGKPLKMEVDTGADISIISEETRKVLFPDQKIYKSDLVLKTYTGEPIAIKGNLHVRVQYQDQFAKLVLVVVEGNGPSLLGRNWLKYIKLDWGRIAQMHSTRLKTLNSVLDQHQVLFEESLGTIEPYRATFHVQPDATPKFFKPRPVPLAIKDAIGRDLDRMEKEGVIERVDHSKWAAPIVAVPKKDGSFRICGDFKVTINQALAIDQYPLPKPEELFATLTGGKVFTKLDLSQAYLQLQLDEESATYDVI